jgi:hypothetical protein
MDADFKPLLDLSFDIDFDEASRDELRQASGEVIDDDTISLMRRENRVGIARGMLSPVTSPAVQAGRSVVDVPLLFALQAHPECVYKWARIVVDLSPTKDAIIADMSPRDVQDVPVDIETTIGVDLSLSVVAKAVDVGAKPELTRKRTVFFPSVTASGTGFRKAYWDFYPKAGDYLHADKELHLLVDAPISVPVTAGFTVRAKVSFRGLARLIPLLSRTGGLNPSSPVRLV